MTDIELKNWCKEYSVDIINNPPEYNIFNTIRCVLLRGIITLLLEDNDSVNIRTVFTYMNNNKMSVVEAKAAKYIHSFLNEKNIDYITYDFFLKHSYESLYATIYNSPWFLIENRSTSI